MKMNFPEEIQLLKKGDAVTVVGASQRRGHLLVESNGIL
jgi:dachs